MVIGQPNQCTIRVLTRRLLENEGRTITARGQRRDETATSAMLVPAMTSKTADASLRYCTDTLAERDKVDVVTLESQWAKAVQPFSIARRSDHKELGRRLFRAIAQSREEFEAAGFHWCLDDELAKAAEEIVGPAVNTAGTGRFAVSKLPDTPPYRVPPTYRSMSC